MESSTGLLFIHKDAVQASLKIVNRGFNIPFDLVRLALVYDACISVRSLWSAVRMDLPVRFLTVSLKGNVSAPNRLLVDKNDHSTSKLWLPPCPLIE